MRDSNNFINVFQDIRTKVLLRGKRDIDQGGSPTLSGVAKGLNKFRSCRICHEGIFGQY
jgi:hypothetical protein